jgi:hypothetical protein
LLQLGVDWWAQTRVRLDYGFRIGHGAGRFAVPACDSPPVHRGSGSDLGPVAGAACATVSFVLRHGVQRLDESSAAECDLAHASQLGVSLSVRQGNTLTVPGPAQRRGRQERWDRMRCCCIEHDAPQAGGSVGRRPHIRAARRKTIFTHVGMQGTGPGRVGAAAS